jgi:hypothetical protein
MNVDNESYDWINLERIQSYEYDDELNYRPVIEKMIVDKDL